MRAFGSNLHHDSDIQKRTAWYIQTRWYFLLAIAIPGVSSNLIGEGFSDQVQRDLFLGILAISSNYLFLVLLRRHKNNTYARRLAITMLLVDIATITVLIFTKGGIESRSPILYTIPMLIASALFGQRGVYFSAALSIGLYNVLILGDFTGVIGSIGAITPSLRQNGTYVLNTITFFSSVLSIIALLADFITRLLTEQQARAERNEHGLEEAQRLAKLGSWTWDIAKDHIVWSSQLKDIFGVDPKKFGGTFDGYLKIVHPEDRKHIQKTIADSLESGKSFTFDHRLIKNDQVVWIHAEGNVTHTTGGKPRSMFGTAQDITTRMEAQLDAARRTEELEKLNELMVHRELKMIELKRRMQQLNAERKTNDG